MVDKQKEEKEEKKFKNKDLEAPQIEDLMVGKTHEKQRLKLKHEKNQMLKNEQEKHTLKLDHKTKLMVKDPRKNIKRTGSKDDTAPELLTMKRRKTEKVKPEEEATAKELTVKVRCLHYIYIVCLETITSSM